MSQVSSRKAALSADSSDDEMATGESQLNADSSDEEVNSKKISADSSDDEGSPVKVKATKISADSSDDEGPVDKLPAAASKSNKIAADSSEDEGPLDRNPVAKKADSSDDDEPIVNAKKKLALKKPIASLDSSDDEDISRLNTSVKASKPILDSDDSDVEKPPQPSSLKADSSDEETEVQSTATKSKKRKIKRTVASDSDSDDATASQNSTSTPSQKSQSIQFTPSQNLLKNKDLYDAESSEDELPEVPYTPSARNKEGSDESNDEDMESLDAIRNKVVQKHNKSPKAERGSAKNAMMEIRSESARITRESAVGLPYHRPKQRTLEEFLNRKKGTPDILKSIHGKKFDSQADKMLEEREKKMKEFYKSESEEEEEAGDKDYDPNADKENNDSVINEEGNMSVDKEVSVKKTDEGVPVEKEPESKIQDSGILSGLGTSDESNQNTDEDKSSPNSPTKIIGEDQENVEAAMDTTEAIESAMETEESLKLVLEPDTPNLESEDDEIIFTSQAPKDDKSTPTNKAWSKLEALKSKFGDLSSLEKTLQMTPTISDGADDDLIICETEKPSLSTGAQKLFSRFLSHAKACKGVQARSCKQQQRNMENLTIVSKKIVDGVEVLEEEIVEYKFDEPKEKPKELNPGTAYLSVKEKLKKEMMEKRKAERIRRAEMTKINNEEGGFDALPDEEELGYDDDEEELDDEDEEYVDDEEGEDEEGESEPEENDIEMKGKKRIKSAFADDEAEDEDEMSGNDRDDDDNDSVALEDMPKKTQFQKIVDPDLLSESSNTSDIFNKLDRIRSDAETPTLNQSKLNLTSAPSSNSSFGALISAEPRWTPFQDRISAGTVELTSAENTLQESPTNSQLAKKKLGFEGLFDQTDPDVSDIDDVIGLCSGKFVTQDPGMSQAANMASGRFVTQAKLPLDISGLTPLDRTKLESVESQDTVILGDNSRPSSRGSHTVETQDTVILTGNLEQNVTNAISSLDKMLALDEEEPEAEAGPGHGAIESDDENEEGGIKIRKRKRRMVSDSEDSEDESEKKTVQPKESVEIQEDNTLDAAVEYDSDENEVKKPKFKQNLFDKKGKLRKDFFEAEAELSGGSDEEFSDDEDERGLDRLEMEEGDLDDIDDEAEAEKVGRIHQKVLLDEDQAALKLFQERFLEDGDLHTDVKRQKQFKWSGLDDNIEVGPRRDEGEGIEQEEETLEKWRLAKMEREKWLQEQEKNGNSDVQDAEDSQFFQLADRTLQRMSSKDETANHSESLEKEKIFKSPPAKFGPLQPLQNLGGGLRGSFLARGDASLDKIAQFNKVKDDRVGAGAKGRNFVFAAISPPKQGQEEEDSPGGKKGKTKQPPAKKMKRCRTLDENSKGTIFNLL